MNDSDLRVSCSLSNLHHNYCNNLTKDKNIVNKEVCYDCPRNLDYNSNMEILNKLKGETA